MRHFLLALIIFFLPAFAVPVQSFLLPISPKRIALTFDDGPRPRASYELWDMLRRHNVKATFFVVGRMAKKNPSTIKLLFNSGHEIANHSWSHPNISTLSQQKVRWELNKTRDVIRELTGVETNLFRTPGSTEHYLRKKFQIPAGYKLVLWDVHSQDHKKISVEDIKQNILRQVKDRDIILLHNGIKNTVVALDDLLPLLKSEGFEFVTVSELMRTPPLPLYAVRRSVILEG